MTTQKQETQVPLPAPLASLPVPLASLPVPLCSKSFVSGTLTPMVERCVLRMRLLSLSTVRAIYEASPRY